MRSAEEIVQGLAEQIAHVYRFPQMFVGDVERTSAADSLETALGLLHWHWAAAQGRGDEFRRCLDEVRTAAACRTVGFADTYRQHHPTATASECAQFVLTHWRTVSERLQVPPNSDRDLSGTP